MNGLLLLAFLISPSCPARIDENCAHDAECPPNSACKPNECDGTVCICQRNFIPSLDKTECKNAGRLGDSCGSNVRCISIMAACNTHTFKCECQMFFRKTTLQSCSYHGLMVLGETCTKSSDCADPASECTEGLCKCGNGSRMFTEAEFWASPDRIDECVENDFSLEYCNGVKVEPKTTTVATSRVSSSTKSQPTTRRSTTTTTTTTTRPKTTTTATSKFATTMGETTTEPTTTTKPTPLQIIFQIFNFNFMNSTNSKYMKDFNFVEKIMKLVQSGLISGTNG